MFLAKDIATTNAPFSLALGKIFDPRIANIVSFCTFFACFASLGSWIMLVAQVGARASHDGNMPAIFSKTNKNNIPVYGVVITSVLMTILMLILMLFHQSTQNIFAEVITTATLLTLLPYFYSALFLIQVTPHNKRGILQLVSAIIGIIFCFSCFFVT